MDHILYAGSFTRFKLLSIQLDKMVLTDHSKLVKIPDEDAPTGYELVTAILPSAAPIIRAASTINKTCDTPDPGYTIGISLPDHPDVNHIASIYVDRVPMA